MVKKLKIKPSFFTLLIIIASFFMAIGYAAINAITLEVNSNVNITTKNELYITNVDIKTENNSIGEINLYEGRYFSSTSTLSKTDPSSSVTYEITIANNTPYIYGYIDTKYM